VRGPGRLAIAATFAVLTLVWGTTWAAIRIGLRGMPPFTGVALRFLVASALLFLLSPVMGVRYGKSPVERRLWLLNGALSFCASYGVVYWSEQWVPSGLASVLFATFPLFVAILAHFALPAERLTARAVLGILTGFCGVAVIFSEDFALLGGRRVAVASLVMLVSPIVSAVAAVAIKRWGRDVHPVSISAVPMAMSVVVMGGVALAVERGSEVRFDAVSVAALLYLAVFGSALTFSLYYWLMRHIPATRLSLIAYSTPVVAVTVGAAFLNEPLTARTVAGSALVVAGVALAVHARHSGSASPSPTPMEGEP
jgi:drug/metabolite transporter (DMT)-like permease